MRNYRICQALKTLVLLLPALGCISDVVVMGLCRFAAVGSKGTLRRSFRNAGALLHDEILDVHTLGQAGPIPLNVGQDDAVVEAT